MTQDYITEIEYTYQYFGQLSPHLINYICALHGAPGLDLSQRFNYCELGCGNGMSTNVMAASNPQGSFFGVDFNHEHIRYAREVAHNGKLDNITFLEENFADLLKLDLPDMDIIAMHGVYSWISEEMQQHLINFFQHKLKPGGSLLMSYNTMPGWAGFTPLREIMLTYSSAKSGNTIAKARQGLQYLRFLCDNEVGYFRMNPAAADMLTELERSDVRYVVHEYFTPHWKPLYFSEVANRLAEVGLHFMGGLPVYTNYGEVCLPEGVQEFFLTAPDRHTFEIHKDFVRNTTFRWDVYHKQTAELTPHRLEHFDHMVFGSLLLREAVALEAEIPSGRYVTLNGDLYERIPELLCKQSMTFKNMLQDEVLRGFKPEDVLSAIHYLIMIEQIAPFGQESAATDIPAGNWTLSTEFNAQMLEKQIFERENVILASEVSGSGVPLGFGEALILYAINKVGMEQSVNWMMAELERRGISISRNQQQPTLDQADTETLLNQQLKLFKENLDYWTRLKLVKGVE